MSIQRLKIRRILIAAMSVIPISTYWRPVSATHPSVLGDCGQYTCQDILTQLRTRWPREIGEYEQECPANKTLGLTVWEDGDAKKVSLACWGEIETDGSRYGDFLGILPFPGTEEKFASSWSCDTANCQKILAQLRSHSPEKVKQYEQTCATHSGTLTLLTAEENSKIAVQCYFQGGVILIDNNHDGVAEGEASRGASVDIILDTFSLPQ